jgi:hypothetical protein
MEEETYTKINKWPFLLADFILIVTALYLAYSAEGIGDSWYILGCLVAVILGAVIIILPFLLDYRAELIFQENEKEESHARNIERLKDAVKELQRTSNSADKQEEYFKRVETLLDLFLKRIETPIQAVESSLIEVNRSTTQMKEKQDLLLNEAEILAGKLRDAIQPKELGKTISDILDQQQAVYASNIANILVEHQAKTAQSPVSTPVAEKEIDEEKETLPTEELNKDTESHFAEENEEIGLATDDVETEDSISAVLEEEVGIIDLDSDNEVIEEDQSEELAELDSLDTDIEIDSNIEAEAETGDVEIDDNLSNFPEEEPVVPEDEKKEEESKPFMDIGSKHSFLDRAMSQTQKKKNLGTGVFKIISNSSKKENLADPLENVDLKDAFESISEEEVSNDLEFLEKKQLAELEKSHSDSSVESADSNSTATSEKKTTFSEGLLFDEDEIAGDVPSKPKKPKKGQTAVIANLLMGIGNKPYIRGVGPGLSLNKGVPMESIRAGVWQWKALENDSEIICKIYKNDETPSSLGEIKIPAGEQIEVDPKF